ncbi:MAG: hypothetical protein N3B18_03220 [Desulfobacterota bacterium]|nr:hypothetical protein [Thermodesulfobacteriota bacterium]
MKKQQTPKKQKKIVNEIAACPPATTLPLFKNHPRHISCFEIVPAVTASRAQEIIEQHVKDILNPS